MAGPYDLFKTDKAAETEGITLDYGEFEIKIARAGISNRPFTRGLAEIQEKYGRRIDAGALDDDTDRRVMCELYAKHVVLSWKGVTDAEGKPLTFSVDNAVKVFMDLPDLFQDVAQQANRAKNFRAAKLEEKKGNS